MSSLRGMAPGWAKRAGRRAVVAWGRRTSGGRMLPGALLAGGQRCGTTSLHRALIAHPQIAGPLLHKGINYFDLNYERGPAWYRGHFPRARSAGDGSAGDGSAGDGSAGDGSAGDGNRVAIESSGYYLYHPLALPRIASDLPDVRLIVMLRDPVERVHSAYKHAVARGFETERFERALELEPTRLAGEEERLAAEPGYVSHAHRHWAYVSRGRYVEQIRRAYELVGRDRVFVLDAERFFERPEEAYGEVLDFLGVARWLPPAFDRHNARPGSAMSDLVRRELTEYFRPYDDELESLLARPLAWRT